jgi:MSHA biogenesis protein MshE
VRMICESCAKPYELSATDRAWLSAELGNSVDSHTYLHGRGCTHCNGTGYRGRTGVYEMLEMTKAVVDAANRQDPGHFLAIAQEEMGGHTLRRHAVALVVAGKTTVAEAMRISNQVDD